jgi:hypothetical protein
VKYCTFVRRNPVLEGGEEREGWESFYLSFRQWHLKLVQANKMPRGTLFDKRSKTYHTALLQSSRPHKFCGRYRQQKGVACHQRNGLMCLYTHQMPSNFSSSFLHEMNSKILKLSQVEHWIISSWTSSR